MSISQTKQDEHRHKNIIVLKWKVFGETNGKIVMLMTLNSGSQFLRSEVLCWFEHKSRAKSNFDLFLEMH